MANGGGGIVYTNETIHPGNTGAARKGKDGKADVQEENIDLLISVLGAANSAATNGPAKTALEGFKQILDGACLGKDMNEAFKIGEKASNDSTYCGTCEKNVANSDTSNHVLKP